MSALHVHRWSPWFEVPGADVEMRHCTRCTATTARITDDGWPQPDVHPPKAPPAVRLAVWVALAAASWLVIAAIVAWWPWSAGVAATLIVAVIAWFGGRDAYLNWRAGREADR